MKRDGNLMWRIADLNNLYLAFWKAQKGKVRSREVVEFKAMLTENLRELQWELLNECVQIGHYRFFTIYDPKERYICAPTFKERVLQHAVMNVCDENFERYQLSCSYASRKGKGVYAAIEKAQENQRKFNWYLKMDVRKYFDSIDHRILMNLLARRFKDAMLLRLFSKLIDSYSVTTGKGLPMGNLSSQYFANHYLAVADHYLKEKLKVKAVIRYMDDIVIWDNNKIFLKETYEKIQNFLVMELDLNLKPICLNHTKSGLPFCGYRIFPQVIKLGVRAKKRFKKKYKEYEHNLRTFIWNESQYQKHMSSLLAYMNHADTWNYRNQVINRQ